MSNIISTKVVEALGQLDQSKIDWFIEELEEVREIITALEYRDTQEAQEHLERLQSLQIIIKTFKAMIDDEQNNTKDYD